METRKNDGRVTSARIRCGRAMLVGLGLDDSEGHFRYTRGDAYELYGGSEAAHREMQRRAGRLREEIAALGVTLDNLTFDEYQTIRAIVERINGE